MLKSVLKKGLILILTCIFLHSFVNSVSKFRRGFIATEMSEEVVESIRYPSIAICIGGSNIDKSIIKHANHSVIYKNR